MAKAGGGSNTKSAYFTNAGQGADDVSEYPVHDPWFKTIDVLPELNTNLPKNYKNFHDSKMTENRESF